MFFPKRSKIFDKLTELSSVVKESARLFQQVAGDWARLKEGGVLLRELEHKADGLVHHISREIEATFILPIDKEDIKELTESLDDFVDNLEQTMNRLNIYSIPEGNRVLLEFAGLLVDAALQIEKGVLMMRERKLFSEEFASCYKKLHEIENHGDMLHRRVLENLMGEASTDFSGKNPLFIIKWKEIYQTLEDTLDVCEKIGQIFEKLRIKYR